MASLVLPGKTTRLFCSLCPDQDRPSHERDYRQNVPDLTRNTPSWNTIQALHTLPLTGRKTKGKNILSVHSAGTITMDTVREAQCLSMVLGYTLGCPSGNMKQGFEKETNSDFMRCSDLRVWNLTVSEKLTIILHHYT